MGNIFNGALISAAGALEDVTIGCEVGYAKVVNVTTNIVYEYIGGVGMSTAGATGVVTQADETLTVDSNGFTIAAAALSADDVVVYTAVRK